MIFKRFLHDREYEIPLVETGASLPNFFLLAPGCYAINGQAYDMTGEGYYIYADLLNGVTHRRLVTNANALNFCSAFSWASTHGVVDNALTFDQMDSAARTMKLRLSCGALHPWVKHWATLAGISARVVRLLTSGEPNGYNDGHVALEVKHNGQWVFADCTFGYYCTAGQTPLSLSEVVNRARNLDLVRKALSDDVGVDVTPPSPGVADVTSLHECEFRTELHRDAWMQRVFQIPGIEHSDGETYFHMPPGTQDRKAWIESLSSHWHVVPKATWDAMFYV